MLGIVGIPIGEQCEGKQQIKSAEENQMLFVKQDGRHHQRDQQKSHIQPIVRLYDAVRDKQHRDPKQHQGCEYVALVFEIIKCIQQYDEATDKCQECRTVMLCVGTHNDSNKHPCDKGIQRTQQKDLFVMHGAEFFEHLYPFYGGL